MKNSEQRDSYNINYIGFCLLGMTVACPSTFCIIANDYWMNKFRDVKHNSSALTPYQVEFTTYFSNAITISMCIVICLNLYMLNRINTIKRILPGMAIMVLMFLLIVLLANINTDTWQGPFFTLSTIIIFLMCCGGQLIVGATFETLSYFPPSYMTSFSIGESVATVFSALLQILSLYIAASSESSANIYFSVGTGIVVTTCLIYLLMLNTSFHKNQMKHNPFKNQDEKKLESRMSLKNFFVMYWNVFKKITVPVGAVFISYCIYTTFYPGITILVNSESTDTEWGTIYFKPTVHYLLSNIAAVVAKLLSVAIQKPSGKLLLYLSCLRVLFVPLLLLSNISPTTSLGVWFTKDYQFAIILMCFTFSYGYISNTSVIEIMKTVKSEEASRALTFVGMVTVTSSECGSFLSLLILQWIKQNNY